jgi:hypothetical protein
MKVDVPKIFLYTMLSLIVFSIGRKFGYIQCQNKYLVDYENQSLEIDSLSKRADKLKTTYDSIKKSPCYSPNK